MFYILYEQVSYRYFMSYNINFGESLLKSANITNKNTDKSEVSIPKTEPIQNDTVEISTKERKNNKKRNWSIAAAVAAIATVVAGIIIFKKRPSRAAGNLEELTERVTGNATHTQPPARTPEPHAPASEPHIQTPKDNTVSSHLAELKTPEAVRAEFDRVAELELAELPANRHILDEVETDFLEFKNVNPLEVLKAKGLNYEMKGNVITIFNSEGKPVRRMYSVCNEKELAEFADVNSMSRIEYINPETGKVRKVLDVTNPKEFSVRMFDENGSNVEKEIFVYKYDDNLYKCTIKDYSKGNIVPEKVRVFEFNDKTSTLDTTIKYNAESGYPEIAYSNGNIYTPRENSPELFDDILGRDTEKGKSIGVLCSRGQRDIDAVFPRLTKGGYIVEKGDILTYSGKINLLDRVTHNIKYRLEIQGDNLMLREYDPVTEKQISILWLEGDKVEANKYGKSPKEVLEEIKETFTDLTPNMYKESSTHTPELIQQFIDRLK